MKDSNYRDEKRNTRQMQTNKKQEWPCFVIDKVEFKVKHETGQKKGTLHNTSGTIYEEVTA